MPSVKIDFGKGSFPSMDEAALDGPLPAKAVDCYQDELGAWYQRPGLTRWGAASIPLPIQGIFWSVTLQAMIAVGNGRVYKISSAGAATECPGAQVLPVTTRARFAEDSSKVWIASGAGMVTTNGTTSSAVTDATAPTAVTHLAWMDSHILANRSGTSGFQWTDAGTSTWSASSEEFADGNLDTIQALGVGWRELMLWGTRSTEIWYNTGETPGTFARIEGAFIERGCSAPYSPIQADNTWWWLDHEREFGRLEGRNFKVLSSPVSSILRALDSVSDLHTNHFQFGNRRFLVLTSAGNDLTLLYDYVLDAWYQWGVWNSQTYSYSAWPVHSIAFSEAWNRYVVIGTNGLLYSISGVASDARFYLRSSHISHGTLRNKMSKQLRLRVKRGYETTDPAFDPDTYDRNRSALMVRWRDNNKATWRDERAVHIGAYHDRDCVKDLYRLGPPYGTRQWEISHTGYETFALISVEEDVDVLE